MNHNNVSLSKKTSKNFPPTKNTSFQFSMIMLHTMHKTILMLLSQSSIYKCQGSILEEKSPESKLSSVYVNK